MRNNFYLKQSVSTLYHLLRHSHFFNSVAHTLITQSGSLLFRTLSSILVARILGPEGRGIFAFAMTFAALGVQFGNIGIQFSNVYYVARDKSILPLLVGNSLCVSFLVAFLMVMVWFFFYIFFVPPPLTLFLWGAIFISIPLHLVTLFFQNLLVGIGEIKTSNYIEIAGKFIFLLVLCGLIYFNFFSVESTLGSNLFVLVFLFFLNAWKLKKYIPCFIRFSWNVFKSNIYYGMKAYLHCLFGFLILKIDIFMVHYFLGEQATGFYSISLSFSDIIYIFPAVVSTIIFPKLSAMANIKTKWKYTQKMMIFVSVGMILAVLFSFFTASPLVELLYGKEYLPSVSPFLILSLAMIFYSVNHILSQFFAAIGLPWLFLGFWVGAVFFKVILNFFTIPSYGIHGAAWSSLVSYLFMLIIQKVYALKIKNSLVKIGSK